MWFQLQQHDTPTFNVVTKAIVSHEHGREIQDKTQIPLILNASIRKE